MEGKRVNVGNNPLEMDSGLWKASECFTSANTPEVAFYSFQEGERSRELMELPSEVQVHDLVPWLEDFGDLVVMLEQLDLVMSDVR
ncbi:MAG: hypothetical protein AB7P69_17200 [Candidatus Binatia bacterium]